MGRVFVFSHIHTYCFRLGKVKVKEGLTWARRWRKATVNILDPKLLIIIETNENLPLMPREN